MTLSLKLLEKEHLGRWNELIVSLPGYSILQTKQWGEVKSKFGWEQKHYIWQDENGKAHAAALILIRVQKVPLLSWEINTIYIPQGPLLDWSDEQLRDQVLRDIKAIAEDMGATFIKIDPELICSYGESIDKKDARWLKTQIIEKELMSRGWVHSSQQIQFKNTAWIDLEKEETVLLSEMKQKSRYNTRKAGRSGVEIRQGTENDLKVLYQMYLETSIRDGFIIRPKEYYLTVWTKFIRAQMAIPLIAEVDRDPIAGLLLFFLGGKSWYLYGMSTHKHREKMPNYLLQWEAIKLSKQRGCKIYDLWGAPEVFNESDSMWGVYRFKKGLGAYPVQRLGAYDLPLKKNAYKIFMNYLPKLLKITRIIRRSRQLHELN